MSARNYLNHTIFPLNCTFRINLNTKHQCLFMSTGFCALKSTTLFMDLNTSAIIHAELQLRDHWMTNLHSARMEYHNLDLGVDVMRSMAMEEIVCHASLVMKAWLVVRCMCYLSVLLCEVVLTKVSVSMKSSFFSCLKHCVWVHMCECVCVCVVVVLYLFM